jgi:hypothetical protein
VVPLDSSWNGTSSLNLFTIEKLYGYFWLLDRQLKLDVAYKGYETRYWRVSDLAGSDWANLDGNIGLSLNFTPSTVNGLSAGIAYSDRSSATIANLRTGGNPKFEDVLASAVIGAKYEVSPISASFMLQFDHDRDTKRKNGTADQTSEGAFRGHLAFKYTISGVLYAQTDWQLAMTGKYKDWDNDSNKNYAYLVGGAKVNYESRPLTAGLTVKLNDGGDFNTLTQLQKDGGIWFDSDKAKLHHSYFVLNPYVYYDLIKDTLQVRLPINVGLDIAPETDSHKSGSGSGFTVEPGLYWNAKRDGAKEDPSRGIRLKYKLGFAFDGDYAEAHDDRGDFINQLTLMFYWDF